MNILILERSGGPLFCAGLDLDDAQMAFEDTDDEMEAFSAFCSV